jgi:hypothetical protein
MKTLIAVTLVVLAIGTANAGDAENLPRLAERYGRDIDALMPVPNKVRTIPIMRPPEQPRPETAKEGK